jgi:fanconi anemia group M protein
MLNYKRWFPNGKIIFVAPTRPLVDQQMKACHDICGIPAEETVVMMGSTKNKGKTVTETRRAHWEEKKVFFCTPQVVSNDIETGDLNAKDVVCLVVDEAHRAVGNYAYNQIVDKLNERGAVYRILALTATPGKEIENVQKVVTSLGINRVEFRSELDVDVAKYTFKREVVVEEICPGDVDCGILTLLKDSLRPQLKLAQDLGAFNPEYNQQQGLSYMVRRFLECADAEVPPFYPLHQTTQSVQHGQYRTKNNAACGHALRHSQFIAHIIELFTKYNAVQTYEYISKDMPHAKFLSDKHIQFKEACEQIRSLASNGAAHSPKLQKLVKIVADQFNNRNVVIEKDFFGNAKKSSNNNKEDDTRVMIFCSFRESVRDIVETLREVKPKGDNACRVKVAPFVGQSSGESARDKRNREKKVVAHNQHQQQNGASGGSDGADEIEPLNFEKQKGQKQSEQKAVLEDFRNGALNCIVATSIGEEGLDIPSVDLIVFYDVVDVIRTVQRMGRTGRARNGKVVVLASKGKEHGKFTKELAKYNYLMKCLKTPAKYIKMSNSAPRMLPDDITPECELICIESTSSKENNGVKSKTAASRAKKARRGDNNANLKYTSTSTHIFDANPAKQYQALDTGTRSILFAYEDEEMAKRKNTNMLPLEDEKMTYLQKMKSKGYAGSLPYQCQYQKVYNFEHGSMTKFLVRAMSKLQGIERSPGASRSNPDYDNDGDGNRGDAIIGGDVYEKRQRAQRIRDGVNLRVNAGIDIDQHERTLFPLQSTSENEMEYDDDDDNHEDDDYISHDGGGDYEDRIVINDDDDLFVVEDEDNTDKLPPMNNLNDEDEDMNVQELDLPDTVEDGACADKPILFSDDEIELQEEEIAIKQQEQEQEQEQVPNEARAVADLEIGDKLPIVNITENVKGEEGREEEEEQEEIKEEVILVSEKTNAQEPPKSPSAAEAARMRLSGQQPSQSLKKSFDAPPTVPRVSLKPFNVEMQEKLMDNVPLSIFKEHVQLSREQEEQRRKSHSEMPPPDPRLPRTNSSGKSKQQVRQEKEEKEVNISSDESMRILKRRKREPKEPSPSASSPLAVADNNNKNKNKKQKKREETKQQKQKKHLFLDDIAGGDHGDDDDDDDFGSDSEDARFIDDESPEEAADFNHHPQYFSSGGAGITANTGNNVNYATTTMTTMMNASAGNPCTQTQPTPMVNLGETFARFGPREGGRKYDVQDTPPLNSDQEQSSDDEFEDSFINDDEIDYETGPEDASVKKPIKLKKKKVLMKKGKKERRSDSSQLTDPEMIAKVSESRHGIISTLPSQYINTEEDDDEEKINEAVPAPVPAAPAFIDLVDNEFEDDWNKGDGVDDDDW